MEAGSSEPWVAGGPSVCTCFCEGGALGVSAQGAVMQVVVLRGSVTGPIPKCLLHTHSFFALEVETSPSSYNLATLFLGHLPLWILVS